MLYRVDFNGRMGIFKSPNKQVLQRYLKRNHGNEFTISKATEDDIKWFKGMGGTTTEVKR